MKLRELLHSFAVAAASLCLGTAAAAAEPARLDLALRKMPNPGVELTYKIAACSLNKAGATWLEFLIWRTSWRKAEMATARCMRRDKIDVMMMSDLQWGGAISEILYRHFFAAPVALNTVPFSALPLDPKKQEARLYLFADCVVRADVAALDRLLRTTPNSDQESGLLAALASAHSGCVPPGRELKANRLELRGAIARMLFLRSMNADVSGKLMDPRKASDA